MMSENALPHADHSEPVSQPDVYPTTCRTWIGRQMDAGVEGRADVNRHVMEVYAQPLRVYLLGSSFRSLGDADDVVRGFFASRLDQSEFFNRWLDSGRPLRYWLIVGFKHYLREQARCARRQQRQRELTEHADDDSPDPEALFHRAAARAMVRQALRSAEQACREARLDDHWRLFVRHFVNGDEYEALANEFNVDRARAAVMARTASNRFKAEMRSLVAWEGATRAEIDHDIQHLMEAARQK